MNLNGLKTLIKKAKTEENELVIRRNNAQMQKDTLEFILKKNAEDLAKEADLASEDINYLFYFGSYKKSMQTWDDVIKQDLEKANKNLQIIEAQTKEAFIERKKFETVMDFKIKAAKEEAVALEERELNQISIEMHARKNEDGK